MLQMTDLGANSSLFHNTSVDSQDNSYRLASSSGLSTTPQFWKVFVPEGLQRDEYCHSVVYLCILVIIGYFSCDERKIEKQEDGDLPTSLPTHTHPWVCPSIQLHAHRALSHGRCAYLFLARHKLSKLCGSHILDYP